MDKLFRFWVVLGFLGLSFGVSAAASLTLTVLDPTPTDNNVSFLADGQGHTVKFHIVGSGLGSGATVELNFDSLPSEITATGSKCDNNPASGIFSCTFSLNSGNVSDNFDIDFSSATEALYALDDKNVTAGVPVSLHDNVDLKFVQPVLVADNNSLQAFRIDANGDDIRIDNGDEVLRYSKVKYQATAGIYNAAGGVYTMGSVRLSMTEMLDVSYDSSGAPAFTNCSLSKNILSCLSDRWPDGGADNNNATFKVEGRVVTEVGESQQPYSANLAEICGSCSPNSYNETDSFSVVSGQDVAVSFDGLPTGTMDVGDEFEFTVKVENNSEAPDDVDTSAFPGANYAVEPTVKVALPEQLEFVSGSGCSGTTNLSCSMEPLTKGNDAELTIGVRVKNVGDAPNKATAAITATVDAGNNDERPGYDANNTVTASVTVATYDVNLNNIIAAPNAVNVGDEFDYTAVINNSGSATIDFRYQKLEMTTTLNGMSFVGLDTNDASRWECNQNGSQLVCTTKQRTETMGTGSFYFTPKLRAPSSINGTSEVISVPSELKLLDRNGGAELASSRNTVSVTVNSTATPYALSLTKTASVSEVTVGEDFEYGFMVTNSGSAALQDVVLTDALPSGVVYRGYRGSGWVCDMSSGVLSCSLGTAGTTLAGGASNNDLVLEVTAPSVVGTVLNTAEVLGSYTGPAGSQSVNATGSVSVEVKARALSSDLAVSLSSDAGNLLAGDAFVVTAMTENKGPDAVSDGVLSMSVSGAVSTVSLVDGGAWSGCQVTGLSVVCPPQDLSNGFASAVKFNVVLDGQLTAASQVGVVATISSSANDPNSGNNSDNLDYQVSLQPTEVELLEHMRDVAGPVDEQSDQAMQNIASFCDRDFDTAIEAGVCENLWNSTGGDQDNLRQMIKEVTPNEVITQSASAAEIMTSQFRNVDARLAELRGGGGGFSLAGLTARYGDQSLPLGMLAYLGADGDAKDRNSSSDFVSPWGFFVNGTVSMGERDSTGREVGFDFDTYGITAGLDYRFSPSKVIGLALGYANFDSELDDEQGEVQSAGFTLTGYGSFYVNDHFYVDSRISYGRPDFEQKRRVQFNLGNLQVDRVASGETEADQYTAAVSMGYHFNKNAWVITPNLTARYTHTSIGAFREYGAGGYNMSYEEQDIESMVVTFGLSVSKALSLKHGVLTPQFDVNMSRELENNGGMIAARFVGATEDEVFWIQTDEPDRTFGNAGLGLVFVGASGKQAYVNYRSVFGLEGFSRGTWNAGLRFEF